MPSRFITYVRIFRQAPSGVSGRIKLAASIEAPSDRTARSGRSGGTSLRIALGWSAATAEMAVTKMTIRRAQVRITDLHHELCAQSFDGGKCEFDTNAPQTGSGKSASKYLMSLGVQAAWLFILAIPVACVAWTITHEEVLRETREYCTRE